MGERFLKKPEVCLSLMPSREVPPAWSVAAQSGVLVGFFHRGGLAGYLVFRLPEEQEPCKTTLLTVVKTSVGTW